MTTDSRVIGRLAYRVRSDRRIAGLAAAGLLGAVLSPMVAATPAAAGPCRTKHTTAAAAADLVKATLLDLGPLGVPAPTVADLTISSARSAVDSKAGEKSMASADYLDLKVLGEDVPAGPLDAHVHQVAPPSNAEPEVVAPSQLNLKLLRAGTGHLAAHATWKPEYGCRWAQGVITESFGSDLDAAILPAMTTAEAGSEERSAATSPLGDGLVTLPSNAFSQTATELIKHKGEMATGATAWIGLTEITLFGGTENETTVKVINPPELRALATGSKHSSSVTYSAPVLEIITPDGTSHRIDSPDQVFELTLPPEGPPTVADQPSAESDNGSAPLAPEAPGVEPPDAPAAPDAPASPDAPQDPVGDLLGGLTGKPGNGSGTAPEAPAAPAAPEAPAGPAAPETPADKPSAAPEAAEESDSKALTLRLSIGHLESSISKREVTGGAASLRLQLLASAPEGSTEAGSEAAGEQATIADVGLGLLSVRASAPPGGTHPPTTPPPAGGGGSLPTTGFNLMAVLATAAFLLVAGRFLMVLGRRRSQPEQNES
ncbi:MAG: hypothetical protein ACRDT4_13715 [Micromonosporaceae bacterium]